MTHTLTIDATGVLSFTYDDALRPMLSLGAASVRRASRVEPTDDCRFTADMGPCGGDVLGPFETHAAALEAEREWLERHFAS